MQIFLTAARGHVAKKRGEVARQPWPGKDRDYERVWMTAAAPAMYESADYPELGGRVAVVGSMYTD